MDSSLPPDLGERVANLERQVKDLQRSQNPVAPGLFSLNDVSGQPADSGMVLEYDRPTGEWLPAHIMSPGDVKWTASPVVLPGRWLLADGSAVSRTTYADLFAAIGTTYGAGDGSTTFNLPNLTGRMVISVGTDAIGATGGARTVTLSSSEMPSHTHTGPSHSHAQNVTAGFSGGTGVRTDYDTDFSGASAFPQGINTDSAGTGATGSAGSGSAHNNLPPYIALYAYVRY